MRYQLTSVNLIKFIAFITQSALCDNAYNYFNNLTQSASIVNDTSAVNIWSSRFNGQKADPRREMIHAGIVCTHK